MPGVTSPDPSARAVDWHERAISLREADEFADAEQHCREAVALFATIEGEECPNLANTLPLAARAHSIFAAELGATHPHTRAVAKNLASVEATLDKTLRP